MRYLTIYRTTDITEVERILEIFKNEGIDFKILEPETSPEEKDEEKDTGLTIAESRIQVEEAQKERARKILTKQGYSQPDAHFEIPHKSRLPDSRAKPIISKWIIFLMVALVVLVAIILFAWFMIPE